MEQRRDPRSVVTPDAFSVSSSLVGLPLARPRTRLAAILVDLVLIAIVSQLGWTLLGVFAAIYFFRMATRRSAKSVFTRAAQYSMGCVGAFILGTTIISATGFLQALFRDGGESAVVNLNAPGVDVDRAALGDLLGGVGLTLELQGVTDEDEAFEAASEVARLFAQTDAADAETLRELLDELVVPREPEYDRSSLIDRVVAATYPIEEPEEVDLTEEELALPLPDALERYAEIRRRNESGEITSEELATGQALGRQIRNELSGDSIAALQATIESLAEEVEEAEQDAADAEQAAAEASERRGFFAWIIDSADELGLGFGWGALYFSALLAWTNGVTPGKRLFRLRVVRLNGEPMTWFMAFERSGGYAAGFATGLLGFAHMLWDPNRMGIHDKIAETVVIKDGAPKVPGTWDTPADDPPAPAA